MTYTKIQFIEIQQCIFHYNVQNIQCINQYFYQSLDVHIHIHLQCSTSDDLYLWYSLNKLVPSVHPERNNHRLHVWEACILLHTATLSKAIFADIIPQFLHCSRETSPSSQVNSLLGVLTVKYSVFQTLWLHYSKTPIFQDGVNPGQYI